MVRKSLVGFSLDLGYKVECVLFSYFFYFSPLGNKFHILPSGEAVFLVFP